MTGHSESERDSTPFMREFDGVARGALEARCYAAEVKIPSARAALELGDLATAAVVLGAILPVGVVL